MPVKQKPKKPQSKKSAKSAPKKTPRTRKPEEMSLEAWQIALRREFGREQDFHSENLGEDPLFSEFAVTNPASGRTYRIAVRGQALGENFCSCPDFRVNTLGTCKHVEWLLSKLERKRGAKKRFREGFHPPYSEIYLHYGAQQRVRWRAGTACPKALETAMAAHFDGEGYLCAQSLLEFPQVVQEFGAARHEVRVYDDVLEFAARARDDVQRRDAIAKRFGGNRNKAMDRLLRVKLYPYQQEGALFAAMAGRCMIADDMGLGKTIQAIAACEMLAQTGHVERALIICPTALKHQWQQEIERFTKRTVIVTEGLQPERRALYERDSFFKITNYETVHRDLAFIQGWRPDLVILDEAQRIKNWETRRAKTVKQLESEYALVLTGTPLENRLEELHSIMEFVDRFHLGPLFRFLAGHQHCDETGRVIGYRNLDQVKESLAPVLIRRRKHDVLQELPGRTDKYFHVAMTREQAEIHHAHQDTVTQIVARWKRTGYLSEKDKQRLMTALQFMRMSCNSTFLIDKQTDHSTKFEECGQLLADLLETPENKVVIFSQWLGTHELLIRRLDAQQHGHAFYHGRLDSKRRKEVLARFKDDPDCRVLLCTDSGGVGLNLQMASTVINMDQPWNPAVLEQRIARVHRLGQHRSVQVYHFISSGTIEHSMLSVLAFKSSMFAGVLDDGQAEVFLGGSKMKKFMEAVEHVSGAIEPSKPAPPPEDDVDLPADEASPATAMPPAPQPEAWNALFTMGAELLTRFGQSLQAPKSGAQAAAPLSRLLSRNDTTGQPELRIPLPDPETADKIAGLLSGIGDVLKNLGNPQK